MIWHYNSTYIKANYNISTILSGLSKRQQVKYMIIFLITNKNGFTKTVLTAVFRRKLPQVKVLHGEVYKGGQFAGSPSFRETLQVWTGRRVKEQLLNMPTHSATRVDYFNVWSRNYTTTVSPSLYTLMQRCIHAVDMALEPKGLRQKDTQH